MGKEKQPRSKIRKLSTTDHAYTTAPIVDRLSALPDDVIRHILSFLPTKKTVQTCILAKRWRSMWAHVPCLAFDGHDYGHDYYRERSMSHIIYRVMWLHKGADIITFYLKHEGSCMQLDFETWIMILVDHNVQNMCLYLDNQFNLPRCLFSCKTLVDLLLRNCRVDVAKTDIVEFPSLKKLRLEEVLFESDSALPNMLSGCPVLEELIIVMESLRSAPCCCNVSSPTLKRLDINRDFWYVDDLMGYKVVYEVKLNTPALAYLRLHDFVSNDFSPGALTSLKEADVLIRANRDDYLYSCSMLEFFGTMKNVKCLRLSTCNLMEVEDSAFSAVLTNKFHNLTDLVLEADWRFIPFFLKNAENLQVLDIRMVDRRIKNWMEPNQVPVCVSSHLRNVTIRKFRKTVGEFELVRYLLRKAKAMKRMEIHEHYGDGELDAVKRISKYCRGSEACELVFR